MATVASCVMAGPPVCGGARVMCTVSAGVCGGARVTCSISAGVCGGACVTCLVSAGVCGECVSHAWSPCGLLIAAAVPSLFKHL